MSIEVTYYKLPNGSKRIITVNNVDEQDAQYLKDTGVKVSMEVSTDGHTIIFYGDYGKTFSDGEPDEILVLGSMNKYTSEELLAQLVKEIKHARAKEPNQSS